MEGYVSWGKDDQGPPSGSHRRSCGNRNLWVEFLVLNCPFCGDLGHMTEQPITDIT